jgi:hypothetical protein
MTDPRSWHQREHASARLAYAALERRSSAIGIARLGCVAMAIVALVAVGLRIVPPAGAWVALGAAVVFVVLVVVHARVDRLRDRRDAAARFHERALGRSAGVTTPGKGTDVAGVGPASDPGHPYEGDLDMTGDRSITAFVSFVRTHTGARTLRAWLLAAHDPPGSDEVRARQGAARALAAKPQLARALWVAASGIGREPEKAVALEQWLAAKDPIALGPGYAVIAWVLPIAAVGALVLGHVLRWPAEATWGPYAVAVMASIVIRRRVGPVASAVVAHEGGALAFAEAFEAALGERFDDARLQSLQKDVEDGKKALGALRGPTVALESSENDVVKLFLAPLFMVELHAVLALERWRARHGASALRWFAAYGALEALASLGLLAHDFPSFAWPEIASEPIFDAKALGHPLVPAERRVCNDVGPLAAGHALVVTGSNMSGKSTLLRSIGVATAMGLAGGPVCAGALVLGPVRLATSMRVSDSLAEGASRFYAELRRLKLVVEMAAKGPGVLFLLDEMLYGTNARERLIGSRATLAWLLEHGALGAVSTHDLALADLGESGPELAARVRNVHFEEQVDGDAMSFDYRLRDGVVKSSNALRLMRELGLPVGSAGPGEGPKA